MRTRHVIPRNALDELYERQNDPAAFGDGYLAHLTQVIARLDRQEIAAVVSALQEVYRRDQQIFLIGNGGSAATASHLAVDLAKGTKVPNARPFRAISLTDNTPLITAQANDEGYDSIFVAQLEGFLRPGDAVIGITASGNSRNLVEAFTFARTRGATTIGLLGFDGGALKDLSDLAVIVRTPKGEYGPVEDVHMVVGHIVTNYIARWLAFEVAGPR